MSYPIDGTDSLHIGTCPCNSCADRGGLEEAIELRASDLIEQGFSEDYAWTKAQDDLCPIDKYDAAGVDTHHDLDAYGMGEE